jgi:hypothetical protein
MGCNDTIIIDTGNTGTPDTIIVNVTPNNINVLIQELNPIDLIDRLTVIGPLTSKWIETASEMDTMQNSLTSNWQETYNNNKNAIIDGGFC